MSLKMFVAVDNTNTFFSDNPYYFYNDKQSPRTPDSASSSNKGFSIFKRRNSKGNSPQVLIPEQMRLINSGNLDSAATMALGSPRGSFGSSLSQQSFELQPMKQRRRSSNSQSETFRERIGSYNESSTCSISPSIIEQEDVFQLSPSKHHHTLPSTGTRRHSFGTWRQTNERHKQPNTVLGMGKRIGRGASATLMDETTKVMVPRAPILSPNKYHGSHRRKDNCVTMNSYYNMDDILIVTAKHSERAILRANFLKNHFDKITKQRGRKPFNFLHIKIEDGPFSEEIANKYQNTALQIIILCPALLALSDSFLMSQLSAIIRSEKVMAILLDVSEEKVKEMHKTALPNYNKWRHCSIRDNDQAQISNILGIATDILGRALCQRPPCQDTSITRSYSSCSEGFTVLPKKVKVGQNKVVVMLTEPLEKDDIVKVVVEKSGELIEIRNFKYRNPFTLQLTIPESCMEISTMVELRIEKNNKSLGARPIKCESRLRELEQLLRIEDSPIEFMCHALGIGPTERDELDLHLLESFQRNMPPNFHLLNGPYEKQHHFLNIRNTRPEEYPTMLHFAARWGLNRLCIQLLECPGGDTACGIRNCVGKTPAELAEQEGHHKLAQNIVSFSEFHELTTMYHYFKGISGGNNNQLQCTEKSHAGKIVLEPFISKPSKTQKSQKTVPLAQPDEYMEMSSGSERENTPEVKSKTDSMAISNLNYISVETEDENLQGSPADIYKNLDSNKVLTTTEEETNEMCVSEPPYYASKEKNVSRDVTDSNCQSDKFSQECSQLLENCSIGSTSNDYILQPSNVPVNIKSVNNDAYDDGNYLFQPSNRPVDAEYLIPQSREQPKCHSSKGSLNQPIYGSLKRTPSDGSNSIRSNADDELAEIMHDFKNNVLSIREVEVLVEKWKHRNDVQQSFREKQDQIELLRKEYDRVQEQIRNKLKRETPLDKIKKLFSRHKSAPHLSSSDKHSGADSVLDDTKSSLKTSSSFKSTSNRPMSTLSLHSISSSASSGRLSTGSNCSGTSLGDSGTHSDHEERRFGCRLGSPGSLIDNYLVPPPPRPVFTPNSTPGDERHQIVFPSPLAPCQRLPSSPSANMEHYQMFPSNIPVYSTQSLSSSQSNNYLNTIMEAKENEQQYQNGVTLQPIKVNERANIIYGKLVKNTPNCSSFKPKQVAAPQVATVEVEVYQNVGDNLDCDETDAVESTKPNQTTDVESETTNKSIETDNDHNYMNC